MPGEQANNGQNQPTHFASPIFLACAIVCSSLALSSVPKNVVIGHPHNIVMIGAALRSSREESRRWQSRRMVVAFVGAEELIIPVSTLSRIGLHNSSQGGGWVVFSDLADVLFHCHSVERHCP